MLHGTAHVNLFRSILAPLMALLVIWPVCCCAVPVEASQAQALCCPFADDASRGDQDPLDRAPHTCACKIQEPRELAKQVDPPSQLATPPAPAPRECGIPIASAPLRLAVSSTQHTGCDPPRLLLARYARWLV